MTDQELIDKYKSIYGQYASNLIEESLKQGTVTPKAVEDHLVGKSPITAPKKTPFAKPSKKGTVKVNLGQTISPYISWDEMVAKAHTKSLQGSTPPDDFLDALKFVQSTPGAFKVVQGTPGDPPEEYDPDYGKWPASVSANVKTQQQPAHPDYPTPTPAGVNKKYIKPYNNIFANASPIPTEEPLMQTIGTKKWSAYTKSGPPAFPKPDNLFQWHIPTNFICGIEYEVECVNSFSSKIVANRDLFSSLVNPTEDNSLKFHGREFITVPMDTKHHLLVYNALFNEGCIDFLPPSLIPKSESKFSSRTSTHVHVNMLALEPEQILALIWWYYLLEPLFFDMAHPSRASNIHCVQLKDTNMHKLLYAHNSLMNIAESWHKYTAFNVKPLRGQGTIEFRHREGISSIESLEYWLNSIESWYQAVATKGLTVSKIQEIIRKGDSLSQLVKEFSPLLVGNLDIESKLLEASIPLRLAMLRNF